MTSNAPKWLMNPRHYVTLPGTPYTHRRLADPRYEFIRHRMTVLFPHVSLRRPLPPVSSSTRRSITSHSPSDWRTGLFGMPPTPSSSWPPTPSSSPSPPTTPRSLDLPPHP